MRAVFVAILGFFAAQVCATEPLILVSVPPLEYFVEHLVGDQARVQSVVPPGANPHIYAPTPRQVSHIATAAVWFRIGEGFETQVGEALAHSAPDLLQVNLLKGLPLIRESTCPHCANSSADPHVWLSARIGQQLAKNMALTLKQRLPELALVIDRNLPALLHNLTTLDQELASQLAPFAGEAVVVSHAAFAYFCRDYQLEQVAIEQEGKEPTPRQLTALITELHTRPVRIVVLQANANNTGAHMVARELDLPTCMSNPLAQDLPHTLRHLAKCIAQ